MRRVLSYAVTGPKVERPEVWPECRGWNGSSEMWNGFPTLATHCSAAADLHENNAFYVGSSNNKQKWTDFQQHHQQFQHQQTEQYAKVPTKLKKRKQKTVKPCKEQSQQQHSVLTHIATQTSRWCG